MIAHSQLKWLYATSIGTVLIALVGAYYDFLFLFALPIVPLVIWILVAKPLYIIYFLAFSAPLSVFMADKYASLNLSLPTEPLIILIMLGVLLKLLAKGRVSYVELRTILSILIISDFLWMLVATGFSSMPIISLKFMISKAWYLIVFYFLLSRLFQNAKIIKIFIWCLILGISVVAAYTLFQHSKGSFSRHYAYTAMRPFLPEHGMYAAMVSFAIPVLFVFVIYGTTLKYGIFIRTFAFGLMLFLIAAVIFSFTRASWLSLVISAGVYGMLLAKIKFKYLAMVVLLVAAAFAYKFEDISTDLSRNKKESADELENHLKSVSNVTTDPSNLERLNRWNSAFRMFGESPIVGFGPGTYTFQYHRFQLPHQMTIISTNAGDGGNVHSEYFRPLCEAGFPSFLLFLALVAATIFIGFEHYSKLSGQERILSLAVFLGLITYFVHGLLNNYSEFDKIAVPMYSFLAVLTAHQTKYEKGNIASF